MHPIYMFNNTDPYSQFSQHISIGGGLLTNAKMERYSLYKVIPTGICAPDTKKAEEIVLDDKRYLY